MDRLQAMTVFVTVVDAGGFASAARKLDLSPPVVTRAVAELEERLGLRLLTRTTRVVRVTEAGARFAEDCRRILAELEEAEESAAGSHAMPRGQLTLTAPVLTRRRAGAVPAVVRSETVPSPTAPVVADRSTPPALEPVTVTSLTDSIDGGAALDRLIRFRLNPPSGARAEARRCGRTRPGSAPPAGAGRSGSRADGCASPPPPARDRAP